MANREKFVYAIYKGENLLCIGTKSKCAEYLKVTVAAIHAYEKVAPARETKNVKNLTVAVKIGTVTEVGDELTSHSCYW